MTKINDSARATAMREYFTEKELNIIAFALDNLASYHEEKASIQNVSGVNTKYKEQHRQAAYDVRELKISLNL